jgi:hypothetical protein
LDGDDFILQLTSVFTRISSGATLVVGSGSAYRSTLLRGGGGVNSSAEEDSRVDLFK